MGKGIFGGSGENKAKRVKAATQGWKRFNMSGEEKGEKVAEMGKEKASTLQKQRCF